MANDDVLFDHDLARITNTAVHVKDGQTYFLAQVSSVRISKDSNLVQLFFAIAFAGVGAIGACAALLMVLTSSGDTSLVWIAAMMFMLATGLLLIGGLLPVLFPPLTWLVLTTSAGEVRVVSSADGDKVTRLRDAVIRAMALRG